MKFPVLLGVTSFLASSYFYLFLLLDKTVVLELEFLSISSIPFSVIIIVDKISLSFSMVVTLISACVFSFACKYMEEDIFFWRFIWVLMAFVISMNLLTFGGSLFFLLLGWDGLGITSFALIIYYQSEESLQAGFQTLMANRIGDALIVSSAFLFVICGQFSIVSLTYLMSGLVFLLSVAALTKSAQFPFSSWLPAAMAAPTPVSALVHSSTLVTAGIFLIIRLSYNLPLSESISSLLLLCGSMTCLLGGWAATFENDIKKIIALSTLSQLGVMVFSLGLGYPALSLFHLYTHALFKALLFLAAGAVLLASFGAQDIRLLGSIGLGLPLPIVMFNVSSLCLIGAPFLSAFYSKHMILEKMFLAPINLISIILMLFATAMTAKYVVRTMKAVSWSKSVNVLVSPPVSNVITGPLVILGFGGVTGGKLLSLIELSNVEMAFIPSFFASVVNLVTVLGLLLGIFFIRRKASFLLATMFFLTPLFSRSTKVFSPVINELVVLDYGWLEPSVLVKQGLSKVGQLTSSFLTWPNVYHSFFRVGWLIFFLVIVYSIAF